MRTVQILQDRYPAIGERYGKVVISPDAEKRIAMISLPDGSKAVAYWIEALPEYVQSGVFCRSSGKILTNLNGAMPVLEDSGVGTHPGLRFTGTQALGVSAANGGLPFNPESHTVLVAINSSDPVEGAGASLIINGQNNANTAPALYVRSTGIGAVWGRSGQMNYAGTDFLNNPLITGITFSTTLGTALRRNGRELMREPDSVTPPPASTLRFGYYSATNNFNGALAIAMVINTDMSNPLYANQLRDLEDWMMAKCGIMRGS